MGLGPCVEPGKGAVVWCCCEMPLIAVDAWAAPFAAAAAAAAASRARFLSFFLPMAGLITFAM